MIFNSIGLGYKHSLSEHQIANLTLAMGSVFGGTSEDLL